MSKGAFSKNQVAQQGYQNPGYLCHPSSSLLLSASFAPSPISRHSCEGTTSGFEAHISDGHACSRTMEGHFWPTMGGGGSLSYRKWNLEWSKTMCSLKSGESFFLPGPRVLKDSVRPEPTTSGQNHECVKVREAVRGQQTWSRNRTGISPVRTENLT